MKLIGVALASDRIDKRVALYPLSTFQIGQNCAALLFH
jgi:hypothetical protein